MYIDIDSFEKKLMNWNVFVSARRNGKTYGICKRFIVNDIPFIYMRRTEADLEEAVKKDVFKSLNRDLKTEYNIDLKSGKIYKDRKKALDIGYALAMTTVRKVRGIEYQDVNECLFDEFIPEKGTRVNKSEDYIIVNAMETIFSNRELPPLCLPPIRMWLCANAIDLYNPILCAFNLVQPIVRMVTNKQQTFSDPDRSLFIYIGYDKEVAEAKKQTSLYKLIGENEITENILHGKFINSGIELVTEKVNYSQYRCLFEIDNKFYVYEKKDDHSWYVSDVKQDCQHHMTTKNLFGLKSRFGAIAQLYNTTDNIKYKKAEYYPIFKEIFNF